MPARPTPLVLLACAALAGCGGGDDDPAASQAATYGINAQNVRVLANAGRSGELERHARELDDLGVDFARASLDWRALEPASGRYDFSATDAWVAALARNGLRWQPTLMGAPTPEYRTGAMVSMPVLNPHTAMRHIEGWYRRRLDVPPGITGHWQVLGSSQRNSIDEMVKLDYLYVANWSLWGDLRLLLQTFGFLAARRGV